MFQSYIEDEDVYNKIYRTYFPKGMRNILKVLYTIGRADKMVTDIVHVLCDQPFLREIKRLLKYGLMNPFCEL